MHRPLRLAAVAALLLAGACSDQLEEGEGFQEDLPNFATEDDAQAGVVNRGEIAQIPADPTITNLTIDGVRVPLAEGSCLNTGLPLEGFTGFQAAIPEREGTIDVRLFPDEGYADVTLVLDAQPVPVPQLRAEVVNEVWYLEEPVDDVIEDTPEVIVVFSCQSPQEDAVEGPEEDEGDDPETGDRLNDPVDEGLTE